MLPDYLASGKRLPFYTASVTFLLCLSYARVQAQIIQLETIMQDPKWLGAIPKDPVFSADGKSILFRWNPEKELNESVWQFRIADRSKPVKVSPAEASKELDAAKGSKSQFQESIVFTHRNELMLRNLKTGKDRSLFRTAATISSPGFLSDGRISFLLNQQPVVWNPHSGELRQLTDFRIVKSNGEKKNPQDSLLASAEMQLFSTLRRRKEKQDDIRKSRTAERADTILVFNTNGKEFSSLPSISPDGKHLAFQLKEGTKYTTANVPSYINPTGYSIEIPTRENVGIREGNQEFIILNSMTGKSVSLHSEDLPGIGQQPDFYKEYPQLRSRKMEKRSFFVEDFRWSELGNYLLADVRSRDNKDRWLMFWDKEKNAWKLADHQRDEAWIGGPAAESGSFGFMNENEIWFLSEASGFSHLNSLNIGSGKKKAFTSGAFEVSDVQFSREQNSFFFLANPEHPGEHSVTRLNPEKDSAPIKISRMKGGHEFILSPDGKSLAYRFSTATRPWELYWQEAAPGARPEQITTAAASAEFLKLAVKEPEYIRIPAEDGANIPARLYRPEPAKKNGAAVIFVHGAGYLQNAHKHWSHYFREFLFHQMLRDEGFTILDLDYRGSAGYGRDWRTGIYRHMGGKDLSDQVDGARFLRKELGADSARIGIYGGSYGGFITLMALCTKPGTFSCGAALRSVTDWMHYNHGYTSNILNSPLEDSLAYQRSSPINFAAGLKGRLLMCHGMQDLNVHYQDIVRFSQRLIELGKENWELASYPLEDHAFIEPESWLDEYRRIYKLFREELLKR